MRVWMIDFPETVVKASKVVRAATPYPKEKPAFRASDKIGTVAIVHAVGLFTKYGLIELIEGSYGTSMVALTEELDRLANDDRVTHVVLRIESPGGETRGMHAAVAAVANLAAKKPVVAFLDDLACSAAYWLAVNATKIVATPGAMVGNVGAFLAYIDSSEALARVGVYVRLYATGDVKGCGLEGAQITDVQDAFLKRHINEIGRPFIDAVRTRRKLSGAQLDFVGSGESATAEVAKLAGLVDFVGGFDVALASINATVAAYPPPKPLSKW